MLKSSQLGLNEVHAAILQYIDLLGLLLIGHGIQSMGKEPYAYFRVHRTGDVDPIPRGGRRCGDRLAQMRDCGRISVRIVDDPFAPDERSADCQLVLIRMGFDQRRSLYRVAAANDRLDIIGALRSLIQEWNRTHPATQTVVS